MCKRQKGFFLMMKSGVRSEVKNVDATVETKVHAILSAMDNLVVPRMELAMRSVRISSALKPVSVVLDPDQRDFSGGKNSL